MAYPVFVAAGAQELITSDQATFPVTKPSEVQDGDLVVVVLYSSNVNGGGYTPGPFTTVRAQTAGSFSAGLHVCAKIAASEPATWTLGKDAALAGNYRVYVFRGATAVSVSAITPAASATANPALPSVTTPVAECLHMGVTVNTDRATFTMSTTGSQTSLGAPATFGSLVTTEQIAASSAVTGRTHSAPSGGYLYHAVSLVIEPPSGDTTAPVLSSPVGTQTGSTTATVGATTDEGNGTLYAVVTTSATQPSVSQIKAGQNNGGTAAVWAGNVAVSSTGAKTLSATGLTASTTYYAHLVHTDAAANDSNRVVSSSFTTAAATVYGFDFHTATGMVFGDLAGALTSLARQTSVGIVARAYSTATGALVATSGTLTTDSAGRLPRWTDAALANATQYAITFVRVSDGEVCATRMTAT